MFIIVVVDKKRIALVLGMDLYYNDDLEQLPSCRKDAEDLCKLLTTDKFNYTIFQGGPVLGSKLNKEYGWADVRTYISNFFASAKPSQTLLFYFSGHGIPYSNDVYLATPQVNPKNPLDKGFALSDLTRLMGLSKSRSLVGILDACYSGATNLPNGVMKKNAAQTEVNIAIANYDKIWKKTQKVKGTYLLLSSQAYGPSNALENSNSLYTKYLIEGLRGIKPQVAKGKIVQYSGSVNDNGSITPESLHEYVYGKVANLMDQVPDIKVDRASTIVLAEYPELSIITENKETYLELLLKGKITDFNKRRRKDGYSPIDLHGVKLEGKDMKGVIMRRADLSLADLNNSNLQGADLIEANLEGSNLRDINLQGADLKKANLKGAIIDCGNLRGCNLESANLSNAHCALTIFDHVIFNHGTWLENANLYRAMFRQARILDAVFDRANLELADFERAKVCASFDHADLQFANLRGANIRGANFYFANLVNARGISKAKARSMGAIVEWVNPYGNK